jgi:hypothetical protein
MESTHEFSTCDRYPHLDPVLLVVVDKRDDLIVSLDAVHAHAPLALALSRLHDCDVVDGVLIIDILFSALFSPCGTTLNRAARPRCSGKAPMLFLVRSNEMLASSAQNS